MFVQRAIKVKVIAHNNNNPDDLWEKLIHSTLLLGIF